MNSQLKETLKLVPELPGCYLYHDSKDEIIYVGKAKNLKRRVHSYFNKKHDNPKTEQMLYLDIEGHIKEEKINNALSEIEKKSLGMRILGSYERN